MTTRKYTSKSQQTTLTSAVTSGAVTFPVVSATTLLGGATISAGQTFTVVIDPDTSLEEIVDITAVSSNNLTVTRGADTTSAQSHSAGAVIRHMVIGRDLREANTHIESSNGVHGLASTSAVVGTIDTQTLTNKTLVSPILTGTTENDSSISFQGATVDAYATTLTVVDPTANRTITLPNTSGTVVLQDSTDTLTNKTITSPIINGTPVITGLSSAGMSASSAAPKNYVDSILGSATAASTSAASAATSASSALTSQTAAATSETSAAASATAAATSATSAATQATAATTSATSAAASATAAATSASSAATSATSAAASVSSISGYATTASNSASASATSATSAAASATAAATSATSAAASATAAATSASSAATTYTAYDQRYLGSKSSAPTVDNLGNALITGATYWNSTSSLMYAWSGSAWQVISTASAYSAPTLGSTTIASGTTYANVSGLTINSTTIPTSKTLVVTTDKLSVHAATTSAELAGVISDETGSGALVFASTPTLVTPVLGAATATSINGTTIPSTKTLVVTTDKLSVHATTTSTELAGVISDETGTGSLVFGTSPALVSPTVATGADATVGIIVTGNSATQSANLQEWKNSTPTTVASISNNGALVASTGTFSGTISQTTNATGLNLLPLVSGNTTSNIHSGATGSGSSKTINIGTAGLSGSTTTVNIGSAVSGATSTINLNGTIVSPKISCTYTAKTAAYTFASGDEGNMFSMNNSATQQFNIPTDATFNFAIGTEFTVFWLTGAGQPTIGAVTPGTTTVISTGATSATPKLRVANSGATCKKIAANSWIIFGDLA
jgi:hypothetical protein